MREKQMRSLDGGSFWGGSKEAFRQEMRPENQSGRCMFLPVREKGRLPHVTEILYKNMTNISSAYSFDIRILE